MCLYKPKVDLTTFILQSGWWVLNWPHCKHTLLFLGSQVKYNKQLFQEKI